MRFLPEAYLYKTSPGGIPTENEFKVVFFDGTLLIYFLSLVAPTKPMATCRTCSGS
jgi:hypothetical protein